MDKTPVFDADAFRGHACSRELRFDILRRTPFFAGLSDEAIAEINARFHERGFAPGEAVITAGEAATELFIVATGELKLLRYTPQGQNVLLDVLAPGDLFGSLPLLGHDAYPDTARARTPCCVLGVTAEEFREILERHPVVAPRVLEFVGRRLREAHEQIRHLSASSVEARLAAILVRLARKLGRDGAGADEEGGEARVPLSQQDLAEMTGSTIETINRTLRRFRDDGAVRTGRGWVAVRDAAELERIAEGARD